MNENTKESKQYILQLYPYEGIKISDVSKKDLFDHLDSLSPVDFPQSTNQQEIKAIRRHLGIENTKQTEMNRYWVSWVHPSKDCRPKTTDKIEKYILGWWVSGYDYMNRAIVVLLIESENKEKSINTINHYWPKAKSTLEWRFFDLKDRNYMPGNRFPIPTWSRIYNA